MMLEIRDICYRYSRRAPVVLDHVSLQLTDGEIGILLGKNGAGKTTLFSVLLGILRPQSGHILFDGRDLAAMNRRERAACIAYVPQNIQFGDLTVYDTVLSGRVSFFGMKPSKEDEQIVEETLKSMHMESLAFRNANELSGGEKQKTAIARALAQRPKLLVFDEPTGNLDIENEQLIIEEMKRAAHEQGISVLTSIHDLNQALGFGERFYLMKEGKICYTGDSSVVNEQSIEECFGIKVTIAEFNQRKMILTGGEK